LGDLRPKSRAKMPNFLRNVRNRGEIGLGEHPDDQRAVDDRVTRTLRLEQAPRSAFDRSQLLGDDPVDAFVLSRGARIKCGHASLSMFPATRVTPATQCCRESCRLLATAPASFARWSLLPWNGSRRACRCSCKRPSEQDDPRQKPSEECSKGVVLRIKGSTHRFGEQHKDAGC
jgi:hypothetical protein